jgi:serine/threonine protein kinase
MRNHDNPRLNHCDDLDRLALNNSSCFEILQEYTMTRILGSGVFGLAILVSHETKQALVIKIMPVSNPDTATEIRTACSVDRNIARDNVLFARVYGWMRCMAYEMPEQWKEKIRRYKKEMDFNPLEDECYFLVMEYGNGVPVSQYRFETTEDCKSFLFELIFALMEANRTHQYHHNDLHYKNVMYIPGPFPERTYRNVRIEAPGRPMIIDYGLSDFGSVLEAAREYTESFGKRKYTDEEMVRHYMEFLMPKRYYPFKSRHGKLRDIFKILSTLIAAGNQTVETHTWLSRLYEKAKVSLNYESVLNEIYPMQLTFANAPIVPRCRNCGNEATHQYAHADSYKFCQRAYCKDAMDIIGRIVNQ